MTSHTPTPRLSHLAPGQQVKLIGVSGLYLFDHIRPDGYATLKQNGKESITCAMSHPIEGEE